MSSATRIFAQRSSTLWSPIRRKTTSAGLAYIAPAATRRGYASAHGAAQKTSEMPLLVSSVGVTVAGLAYLLSGSPKSSGGHGPKSAGVATGHHPDKEKEKKAAEPKEEQPPKEEPESAGSEDAADKASESKQGAPSPSDDKDKADQAAKPDEKKPGKEESKDTTKEAKEGEKTSTNPSTTPSKETATKDAQQESKQGEGEAVKKDSPKKDSSKKDTTKK